MDAHVQGQDPVTVAMRCTHEAIWKPLSYFASPKRHLFRAAIAPCSLITFVALVALVALIALVTLIALIAIAPGHSAQSAAGPSSEGHGTWAAGSKHACQEMEDEASTRMQWHHDVPGV